MKEIKNEETSISSSEEMNDSDRLNDALLSLKHITNSYSIALNEASCEHIYNEYLKVFKDAQDMQRDAFNLIFKNGWYKLEEADESKSKQKYEEYKEKKSEL